MLQILIVHRYPHSCTAKIISLVVFGILAFVESSVDKTKSCRMMKPLSALEKEADYYINTWAVRVLGGVKKAKSVAKRLGYDFHKKVSRTT